MLDKPQEDIRSRRDFLTRPFKPSHPPQPTEVQLERKGNVATVSKPEATYTFIYDNAFFPRDYSNQLPTKLDWLILETSVDPWMDDPLRYLQDRESYETSGRGYFNLFTTLRERKTPVIFADFFYKNDPSGVEYIPIVLQILPIIAETKIGMDLLEKIAKEKNKRREFLKLGAKGVAAAWLLSPALGAISGTVSNAFGKGEEVTTEFVKVSNAMHPEDTLLLVTLRNTVIAHKEEWFAKQKGNHPHFATLIGVGHAGIEDQIQYTPEERMEFLQKLKPLLQTIVRPEEFYRIAEFRYDGQAWGVKEIHEVPELKKLVET